MSVIRLIQEKYKCYLLESFQYITKEKLQELNLALPAPLKDDELDVYLHFHHEAGNILYFRSKF
jgi:hypothetical protein